MKSHIPWWTLQTVVYKCVVIISFHFNGRHRQYRHSGIFSADEMTLFRACAVDLTVSSLPRGIEMTPLSISSIRLKSISVEHRLYSSESFQLCLPRHRTELTQFQFHFPFCRVRGCRYETSYTICSTYLCLLHMCHGYLYDDTWVYASMYVQYACRTPNKTMRSEVINRWMI